VANLRSLIQCRTSIKTHVRTFTIVIAFVLRRKVEKEGVEKEGVEKRRGGSRRGWVEQGDNVALGIKRRLCGGLSESLLANRVRNDVSWARTCDGGWTV
jgi:hypothetical protein